MNTQLLPTTDLPTAANIIRNGGVVAFPTETVYGLGANALDSTAILKIFAAKGRPADNPLIVHIADKASVVKLAREIPPAAKALMDKLWPGALTLIFKKTGLVCDEVTCGLDTVAVRMPENEAARELIGLCGVPVAAPSANISGRPSPTSHEHVLEDMFGKIDAIVEGEVSAIGVESTVLDMTTQPPLILRPGGVTKGQIEAVIGHIDTADHTAAEKPKSPGMKYRHYAPNVPLYIVKGTREDAERYINEQTGSIGVLDLGGDPAHAAHTLFDALRKIDKAGYGKVFAYDPPHGDRWESVRNRLYKAAGYNVIDL